MYKKHILIQVHKVNTELVPVNGGILAGCGFAVHFLKSTMKVDVKEEGKGLRYFVNDMVLFKESDNNNFAVEGIVADLDHTRSKLRAIGQIINDGKEQIFVPFESTAKKLRETIPDYKGQVEQAVVDL
eukprot:16056919-Heterocapsa_arctica.AAC.1